MIYSMAYKAKARRLIEITDLLKEHNKSLKKLKDEKKLLEEELMNFIELQEKKNNDDNIEIDVDGRKVKLKKMPKQKPINDEVLKTSLVECVKDMKLVDKIANVIDGNREKYDLKKIMIK